MFVGYGLYSLLQLKVGDTVHLVSAAGVEADVITEANGKRLWVRDQTFLRLTGLAEGGEAAYLRAIPQADDISEQRPCSGSSEVLELLHRICHELAELKREVKAMSDTAKSLDQAVDDLGGAVSGKLSEDQTLRQQAAEGRNEAADVAKVEGLVGKLNDETATEKAEDGSAPAPAPAPVPAPAPTPVPVPVPAPAPVPTATVTVTGQDAAGNPIPNAPVATGDAPASQQVPTSTITGS